MFKKHGLVREVVEGMISLSNSRVRVLFDSGSTHLFIDLDCALRLGLLFDSLDFPLCVSTPVGENVKAETVCNSCSIWIEGFELLADLIVMPLFGYDIILGID